MNGGQEENSKRSSVFMFSVILIDFSGKRSIFVIHFIHIFCTEENGS